MNRLLRWLLLFIAVAAVSHVATIALTPRALMWIAMHRIGSAGTNRIVHAPRADEQQRTVVMPSPDFLYSYCVYDLRQHTLRIRASVPPDSYWSVSLYDAKTDNFYAADDQILKGRSLDLLLLSPKPESSLTRGLEITGTDIVHSPSRRGVVLIRTLIDRDERLPELDAIRRQATCEAISEIAPGMPLR